MKASQNGENKTVLTRQNIKYPSALTIDLVLRKVICIDGYSNTFSSIDFDGNNFITFGTHNNDISNPFIQIFGDNIYWAHYENSIFKTRVGVNDTQMDYLITSKTIKFYSFKIIDASLQPNSTNRCVNNNCSHICIPINTKEYRCTSTNLKNSQIISEPTISSKTFENAKTNSESMPTTTTLSNEVNNGDDSSDDLLFYIFVAIFGFLLILISSFCFFTYLYRRKRYSYI
jgi:hypothetical protein